MIAARTLKDKTYIPQASMESIDRAVDRGKKRQQTAHAAQAKASRKALIEHATAAGTEDGLWAVAERPDADREDLLLLVAHTGQSLLGHIEVIIADPAVPAKHASTIGFLLGHLAGLYAGIDVIGDAGRLRDLIDRAGDRRDAAEDSGVQG